MTLADADVVVLRKVRRFAPAFHRHILASRIQGQRVQRGDVLLVYRVEETIPDGPVMVTPATRFEFQ
jgi:hypothetical protein